MRIRKPRGLTRGQIVLVTTLGVFSGIYIWKPLFEDYIPRKRIKVDSTGTDIALTADTQPDFTPK